MNPAQLKAYRRQLRDPRITADRVICDLALEFVPGRKAFRHNVSTSNREPKNQ